MAAGPGSVTSEPSTDPPRWSTEQVLALVSDASSQQGARALATPSRWREAGSRPPALWGLCQGSGAKPYQTCVDLAGPAYRCSCPSRKFPCKHALSLMLMWSAGRIEDAQPPDWVSEWLASRTARATAAPKAAPTPKVPDARTVQRREERVSAGLAELDRWLTDQVRQGITSRADYDHWDGMGARLVDSQAPGLASAVRRLAYVAGAPDRLLTELALIRLLVTGYRRGGELPTDLTATIRARVGFPVATADVLAGPAVRDDWAVLGVRDEGDERLTTRRCWLHGARTGRPALVLSFAPLGQPLAADLVPGTTVEADLCFYPGALPLRALVATRHAAPVAFAQPPGVQNLAEALAGYAGAIAAEPWLERWPMLLGDVTPVGHGDRWYVRDPAGAGLPLDLAGGAPWRLVAAAAGRPVTLAGELTTQGLRPVSAWSEGRLVAV